MESTVSDKTCATWLLHWNGTAFEISSLSVESKPLLTSSKRADVLAYMDTELYIVVMKWTSSHQFGVLEKSFRNEVSVIETGNIICLYTVGTAGTKTKTKKTPNKAR